MPHALHQSGWYAVLLLAACCCICWCYIAGIKPWNTHNSLVAAFLPRMPTIANLVNAAWHIALDCGSLPHILALTQWGMSVCRFSTIIWELILAGLFLLVVYGTYIG